MFLTLFLCHTSIFTGPYPFASAKPRVQDRSNMGKAPNWTQTLCREKQIQKQQQRTSSPPMKNTTLLHWQTNADKMTESHHTTFLGMLVL